MWDGGTLQVALLHLADSRFGARVGFNGFDGGLLTLQFDGVRGPLGVGARLGTHLRRPQLLPRSFGQVRSLRQSEEVHLWSSSGLVATRDLPLSSFYHVEVVRTPYLPTIQ